MHPFVAKFLLFTLLAISTACTPFPKAELNSYTKSYALFEEVSNDVLDLVIPYERISSRSQSAASEKCLHGGVLSGDPYCYEIRDSFATIGDPKLVDSYRNLLAVIGRYNAILLAYSDGATMKFIQQDLDGLTGLLGGVGDSVATELVTAFSGIKPVSSKISAVKDRHTLGLFLVDSHALVDTAFVALSQNTNALYANVSTGTAKAKAKRGANVAALNSRRKEIRDIIANWTVLMDENRKLLGELKFAIENQNNIEVRLRNLSDDALPVHAGLQTLKGQISNLGAASLIN